MSFEYAEEMKEYVTRYFLYLLQTEWENTEGRIGLNLAIEYRSASNYTFFTQTDVSNFKSYGLWVYLVRDYNAKDYAVDFTEFRKKFYKLNYYLNELEKTSDIYFTFLNPMDSYEETNLYEKEMITYYAYEDRFSVKSNGIKDATLYLREPPETFFERCLEKGWPYDFNSYMS